MGPDYYIYTYLNAYNNGHLVQKVLIQKQGGYFSFRDYDDSDDYNSNEEKYNKELKEHKRTRIIFENEKWLIKNRDNITYYEDNLQGFKYDKIVKYTFANMRY